MQDEAGSSCHPIQELAVSKVDQERLRLKGPGFFKLYPRGQAPRHLIHAGRAPYLFITVATDTHRCQGPEPKLPEGSLLGSV